MSLALEEVEKHSRGLSPVGKAAHARKLIEKLDAKAYPNIEQLWLEEAQRRYDAFLSGELEARTGDEVIQRARDRLRSALEA